MRRYLTALVLAVILLVAGPLATMAAEPPATPDPEPWRFNVALYGWAMSVSGNVTARNQTIDTSASFIDLVQKSDSIAGFMGYFEADRAASASIPTWSSPSWASAPARPTTAIPCRASASPPPPTRH